MNTELTTQTRNPAGAERRERAFVRPLYRVDNDEHNYHVSIEMPGVTKDEVDVDFDKQQLTVTGRRTNQVPDQWKPVHLESAAADYRLRLQVGVDIDREKTSAQLEDGILRLRLPLAESAKPRRIEIA